MYMCVLKCVCVGGGVGWEGVGGGVTVDVYIYILWKYMDPLTQWIIKYHK